MGRRQATRSFLYIDDCIEGTLKLFNSDFRDPLNIGSDEQVSINQLIEIAENVSNFKVKKIIYLINLKELEEDLVIMIN